MTPKVPHGRHMGGRSRSSFHCSFVAIFGLLLLSIMLNYYRFETALDMSIIQLYQCLNASCRSLT